MFTPPHAYVPGKTPRHEDEMFESIRETARAGMSPTELAGCAAFAHGLWYLREGYYWEAHEVLEPVWMALPAAGEERALVQALIQLANGYLKRAMGRPKAALRLCGIVRGHLAQLSSESAIGVKHATVLETVVELENSLDNAI